MSEFAKLSQRELRRRAEYTPTCDRCGWSSFSIEVAVRSGWWYAHHLASDQRRCACPWCRARSRALGHGDPAQLGLGL